MDTSRRQSWLWVAFLVAVVYLLVGIGFAIPRTHVRVWRLAAWLASAAAYAAHLGYEHFRLRTAPRAVPLHAALAVAIGAFALAVAAIVHRLWAGVPTPPSRFLAFVVWPIVTGVPAFLVARVAGALLVRLTGRGDAT